MSSMPIWAEGEEFANSLTHGIGAALAAVASFFLIRKAILSRSAVKILGNIVFSISMIELYTVSAVYHGLSEGPAKRIMRFVDHCSVFGLIAGSYTPITLTSLRRHGGPVILAIVWLLFAAGIFGKIAFFDLVEPYTVYLYIAMGWIVVFSFGTLVKCMSRKALAWLTAGGVAYTAACIFFVLNKPFHHAVFHVLIMVGTLCHVVTIGKYI